MQDKPTRVVIMGAAGRDFHNFNVVYRNDPNYKVVAFTAAQIPGIADRSYPAALAGPIYPQGIPIIAEELLEGLCHREGVDLVVFAYSDVKHEFVMHKASIALAAGADFALLGPKRTMLKARCPVISICAVRTGVGKSQTARWLSRSLSAKGVKCAVVRHPMPYGDLERQVVQRFASLADLDTAQCTIEEREEYEPHIAAGNVVFAGVDYERILRKAEQEADIVLWDGGNNDFSFYQPDLQIALVDPLRPDHETSHHPGETVLRMADIVVVAKCNSAPDSGIQHVIESARRINERAIITRAESLVTLDDSVKAVGKRAIVVEDGPTITHGGMSYGAGYIAATRVGVAEIVDPRASAVGDIKDVFSRHPHIGKVLPAMGYSTDELKDLEQTINGSAAEVVINGSPTDLEHLIKIDQPMIRARYEFSEVGEPRLSNLIDHFAREKGLITGSQKV